MSDNLLLIDGNSLMHRGFYAINASMTSPQGRPTNAIFGFLGMLLSGIEQYTPKYILIAFDMHAPTFRHSMYPQYKAGRRETPPELREQFPMLRELLTRIGIACVDSEGFEADDIIGTASAFGGEDVHKYIVTGDRDALQLISPCVTVILTQKGLSETAVMTPQSFEEKYGIIPERVTDLKGLMGDSSDNIPGIAGVGEKTALTLLRQYDTLEEVLEHASELKGKLAEKVEAGRESAEFSKKLATISREAPMSSELGSYEFKGFNADTLAALSELGMAQYVKRLSAYVSAPTPADTRAQVRLSTPPMPPQSAAALLLMGEDLLIADKKTQLSIGTTPTLLAEVPSLADSLLSLKPYFEGDSCKYVYDAKAWMTLLARFGIALKAPYFDVMIAEYLLEPLQNLSLQSICARYMKSEDAGGIYDIAEVQRIRLEAAGEDKLLRDVELPLCAVLYEMQTTGFMVDAHELEKLGETYSREIATLEKGIIEQAGEEFNISSPKQLGGILFDKLHLPSGKKTKSGWSTDASVLEALEDEYPIARDVLRYRTLTKLKSTYIDALIPRALQGRVHSTFNQTVTATGRISSSEPNLQNIPVREAIGRQIRAAFVAEEGNVLIDADYSQIELRVLAHISGDVMLRQAFLEGKDIHTQTAAQVFRVDIADVTREMRSASKAVNFGIVYGISDFGLAKQLGVSRAVAGEYINNYLDTYSGVRQYMHTVVDEAREKGYVSTLYGRRRPMPELKSAVYTTRAFGERVAMNAPIQGTAADIIKVAMVEVVKRLKQEGMRTRLILQVHDELILESPIEEADRAEVLLRDTLEQAAILSVPLKADISRAQNWLEAKQ